MIGARSLKVVRRMLCCFGFAALCATAGCSDDALHPFVVRACKCEDRACAMRVVNDLMEVARSRPRARGNLAETESRIEQMDKCLSRFGVSSGISAEMPGHR